VGFPRHLSQHVGGFVLTRERLDETVPIGNGAMPDRTFIEWDKDDIDTLRILKVDVLGLGMLTCIRKCLALLERHRGLSFDLASVPRKDEAVYDMLCEADSIGVFQVESRAQMNMLPRLRPREFYDLVIEVAIVRPGPIQGDMVHPYLKRRSRQEAVVLPSPAPGCGPANELQDVLGKTLGVPLFQEQAMRIAIEAAKFTAEEANQLRRAMATFRHVGTIHEFEQKMVERMVARGYDRTFAEHCFSQIKGFGEYGFPESHAASFARLVWVSAWLKCHHPAVFACGLLNSQPMGFYAPAQIVRDAHDHGVEVRPVDINASAWDCTLERREDRTLALRLGFRQIDGFRQDWAGRIEQTREAGFPDLAALHRRSGLPRAATQRLAAADALGSLDLSRRPGLWAASAIAGSGLLPLFAAADTDEAGGEASPALPPMPPSEEVIADYQTLRLSLKAHPISFLRDLFRQEGVATCAVLARTDDGTRVRAAGLVLVRQRPGSSKGVVFMTLEDETGIANAVLWPAVVEAHRREVMAARLLLVDGRIQKSPEGVVHLVATRLHDRSHELRRLAGDRLRPPLARADEVVRPQHPRNRPSRHPRDECIIPKSRDFH
jgi:error-prone DNA polymerase